MNDLKLINATGESSKIGRIVKQSDKQKNAFVYASPDETQQVFVISEDNIPKGKLCDLSYLGLTKVFVRGNVKSGDAIRSRLSTDKKDRGAGFVVQSGDATYIYMGVALESGRNTLINVALNIRPVSS